MTAHTFEEFKSRFDALSTYIESTEKAVNNGILTDLSALDKQVIALCKDVETTGGQVAKDAQPLIVDMIARLDGLAAALHAYKMKKEQGSNA